MPSSLKLILLQFPYKHSPTSRGCIFYFYLNGSARPESLKVYTQKDSDAPFFPLSWVISSVGRELSCRWNAYQEVSFISRIPLDPTRCTSGLKTHKHQLSCPNPLPLHPKSPPLHLLIFHCFLAVHGGTRGAWRRMPHWS